MSKLSEQQEKFCRNVVEGMSQTDAYIAAGYKVKSNDVAKVNASRLLTNANVADRIAELRQKAVERTEVTLEWLVEEAVSTYRAAREDSAHAAATGALKEVGILTGLRVEKSERTNRNIQDVEDLDRSELLAIASSARAAAQDGRGDGSDSIH
tara:strand:- start:193 stop:651 length:459 start_codon:yes stop_codon:yes gene_type:complete